MKKTECWMSDDGHLERHAIRAKAHDLHAALPKSSSDVNSKILSWTDCLRILENADLVAKHIAEFNEHREMKP